GRRIRISTSRVLRTESSSPMATHSATALPPTTAYGTPAASSARVALRSRSLTFSAAMSALSQPMGSTAASAMTNAPCDFFYRNRKARGVATRNRRNEAGSGLGTKNLGATKATQAARPEEVRRRRTSAAGRLRGDEAAGEDDPAARPGPPPRSPRPADRVVHRDEQAGGREEVAGGTGEGPGSHSVITKRRNDKSRVDGSKTTARVGATRRLLNFFWREFGYPEFACFSRIPQSATRFSHNPFGSLREKQKTKVSVRRVIGAH